MTDAPGLGFSQNVVDTVRRMVSDGYESKRAWTTALFFTPGSPVEALFNHNQYGIKTVSARTPRSTSDFYDHVTCTPSRWFAGPRATFPKQRMLACAKANFKAWHDLDRPAEELVRDALLRLVAGFAHDSKSAAGTEGGPKMFFLASVWQMLYAIPQARSRTKQSIRVMGQVIWPGSDGFDDAWAEQGQPMLPYSTCSMYVMRSDETLPPEASHEFFFTLDVDGINALSREQEKGSIHTRDELCQEVMQLFSKNRGDDDPAILTRLSDILVEIFGKVNGAAVKVAWHRTVGYKPSWRAYVVGAWFRDNYEAKAFVQEELSERCAQMFKSCLPEPFCSSERLYNIVDCGTYADGWDRCVGSAKLNSAEPSQMRFLSVQPIESLTHPALFKLFHECPNRYLLTVLGWVYPEESFLNARPRSSFVITRELTAGSRSRSKKIACARKPTSILKGDSKRARTANGGLDADQNQRFSDLIARSLTAHGFVHSVDASKVWRGEGGVVDSFEDGSEYMEMRAASGDFMLCAYRNCAIGKHHEPRPEIPKFDTTTALHSGEKSAGKMNFRISLNEDRQPWVQMNCFKCGGEFGHKMQFMCPVLTSPGVSVREYVLGKSEPLPLPATEADDCVDALCMTNISFVVDGVYRKLFF
jgi:hypothetical protein